MLLFIVCAALTASASSATLTPVGAPPRPLVRTGPQCSSWYDALEPTRVNNMTYRNVKWYGAKGDGVSDDSAAFIMALTYNRCEFYIEGPPHALRAAPVPSHKPLKLVLYR